MKISWIDIPDRIRYELRQRNEDGSEDNRLTEEWNIIEKSGLSVDDFNKKAEEFYKKLAGSSLTPANNANEPNDWEEIKSIASIKPVETGGLTSSVVENRILGGWLGRSAGCLLGKPVEKTPRAGIKELLNSNNTWPLSDYVSGIGIPDPLKQKYPWNRHDGFESLKENIVCMNEDDDMNYPMINLLIYEKYGEDFSTENVIQTWMEMLPVLQTFTAERVAYLNTLNGLRPPETALKNNPYREWIGAQIRADVWGWVNPGNAAAAAEYAYRDARLSHVSNGIYGEIYIAAAVAEAFVSDDINEIIRRALNCIPPKSRLAEAIKFVLSLPVNKQPWEDTLDALYERFGYYHWVHTINNAALVTAALLSSDGNYEKAICNCVMGGWDTDSNGASVGSVMGTMIGAGNLPDKWISPLNNKIRSSLKGFDNSLISDLALRTAKLAKY